MRDLSVKGIARKYAGNTADLSVKQELYGGHYTGTVSLRAKLESLARRQHSFSVSECVFGWNAAFEQTWTHIIIRIRLTPDSGISQTTMNSLRTTWQNAIESTWSNRWGCGRSGEITCPLTFDVQWVTSGQHHSVRVRDGAFRSNMTTWDTADGGGTAAHEVGHMLGHIDEYADSTCPGRNPTGTGTIMDNNSNNVPSRLMQRFAETLGSNINGL